MTEDLNTARMFRQVALSFAVTMAEKDESTKCVLDRAQKFYEFCLRESDGKAVVAIQV